eukprot:c23153_g1_i1 orf=192-1130(+)
MADRVQFITLPDGRRLAFREMGCAIGSAKRSLLALHGILSSGLGAMPGVSEDTLRDFGVRLVALDRPGYGQSDPHPSQTFYSFCKDIATVIKALNLGEKVWLLGFSMGGAFCWAAARYIPDRIAGIALWSPVGSYFWKGISKEERAAMLATYSATDRSLCSIANRLPFFVFRWYGKWLSARLSQRPTQDMTAGLSPADWKCAQRPGVMEQMASDYNEAMAYSNYGVAKDLQLMIGNWGFEPEEIDKIFKGKIHIWQGDNDWLVPLKMQQWVQKQLPEIVQLYELRGEGHISWVCCNDHAHRETLKTLFGSSN